MKYLQNSEALSYQDHQVLPVCGSQPHRHVGIRSTETVGRRLVCPGGQQGGRRPALNLDGGVATPGRFLACMVYLVELPKYTHKIMSEQIAINFFTKMLAKSPSSEFAI